MKEILSILFAILGVYYILVELLYNRLVCYLFKIKEERKIVHKDCKTDVSKSQKRLSWENRITLLLKEEYNNGKKKKLSSRFLWSLYLASETLFQEKYPGTYISINFFLKELDKYTHGIKLPTERAVNYYINNHNRDDLDIETLRRKLGVCI